MAKGKKKAMAKKGKKPAMRGMKAPKGKMRGMKTKKP